MRNEKLFNETIDILVQAYMNDMLKSGTPCGCAIGNMLLARGVKVDMEDNSCANTWYEFVSDYRCRLPQPRSRQYIDEAILATGYELDEILSIERAFEGVSSAMDNSDETMFNR